MSLPAVRTDCDALRALVIGVGLCWSVAFVAIALTYQLALYADGAMFSYAVAAQDVWAFHWHNSSGRLSVYFLSLLPAQHRLLTISGSHCGLARTRTCARHAAARLRRNSAMLDTEYNRDTMPWLRADSKSELRTSRDVR